MSLSDPEVTNWLPVGQMDHEQVLFNLDNYLLNFEFLDNISNLEDFT
jgi:hypothetical protein